jgi:hypothetical protein
MSNAPMTAAATEVVEAIRQKWDHTSADPIQNQIGQLGNYCGILMPDSVTMLLQ